MGSFVGYGKYHCKASAMDEGAIALVVDLATAFEVQLVVVRN